MKKTLIFATLTSICLMLLPTTLFATPTPEMFAYGMKLDTRGGNAFYELELPLDVYKAVTSKDLHDIRVFNSEGAVVPHIIYSPDNRTHLNNTMEAYLPFFPISSPVNGSSDEITVHIEKDEQGAIVDVKTVNGDGRTPSEQKIVSYLIDSGKLKGKSISALELEWSNDQADFMGSMYVESSSDLHNWRRIASTTIARLQYGNYRLDRKKIALPRTGKSYLRLSWPDGQKAISLTKVLAISNRIYTVNRPGYRWTKALVSELSEKPGHYKIDMGGFLPADRINIRLKDRNSMAAVRLFSGLTEEKNNTIEQWKGLIYNLDYQGTSIYNSTINTRGSGFRDWLLTFDESETALGNPPDVEFGWEPQHLLFLAQGKGPFQIAYGSAAVPRPDFKVDPLMRKYQQGSGEIKPARGTPGPQYVLAGTEMLLPAPPGLPWKKYILWASLFAGVLAIGLMSVSLFRQLQAADKNGGPDSQA